MKKIIPILMLIVILLSGCQTVEGGERSVMVSGSASVTMAPDMASFSVSVEEMGETTAEAQKNANAKMEAIYAILSGEYGVSAQDIRTTGMSLYPQYRYENGQQILVGQSANQSISVTLHNLDDLAPVVDSLSQITGISLSSISLDASDKSSGLAEARRLAVEDAAARARDYAESAGLTLGTAIQIQEGGSRSYSNRIQPTALYSMAMDAAASAGGASASYYAGDLTVSADVSVLFEMK